MTKYPPGTRVKVAGGSGIDSDKSGTVIAWSDPKAKETLEGNRRLQGKGWIAILFDDGSVSCQPKSRLSAGGPKVEAGRGPLFPVYKPGGGGRKPEVVAPVGYAVRFLGTGLSPKMSGVIVAVEPDAKFGRLYRVYAENYPSEDGTCLRPRHALYEVKTPTKQAMGANMRIINYDRIARQVASAAPDAGRTSFIKRLFGITKSKLEAFRRQLDAAWEHYDRVGEHYDRVGDDINRELADKLEAINNGLMDDFDRWGAALANAIGAQGSKERRTGREAARPTVGGESESGPLDLGPDAADRPVRREPHGRTLPKGKGRGRWLALDTMDHIIGSLQRSQQKMSAGGVQDGAHLVRVAFDELRSLHESLGNGVLTDDAWDV
jgi:hypothetical protein